MIDDLKCKLVVIIFFFPIIVFAQDSINISEIFSTRTTGVEREKFHSVLIENTIEASLLLSLNSANESKWVSAFWAMELIGYKNEQTFNSIKSAFDKLDVLSLNFHRALLEVVFTLYPNEFCTEVRKIFIETNHPKIFAMAGNYLSASLECNFENDELSYYLSDKFPEWKKNPILYSLYKHLISNSTGSPTLTQILSNSFLPSTVIVYCLQRENREFEGLIVIRNKDGKYLRDDSGKIFSVPALARSVTNLPYYITNGNSPEGIYSLQKINYSSNVFIGPTPTLEIGMPFELSSTKYFHANKINEKWSKELYSTLLPDELKKYHNLYQTFYAGKAARTEIIVHGTTINPQYYKSSNYFPNTPSLGCITLSEIWDEKTGKRIASNQAKLIGKLSSMDLTNAYFVLINIDNNYENISVIEIERKILEIE